MSDLSSCTFPTVAKPSPFDEAIYAMFPHGTTIAEIVGGDDAAYSISVEVGGIDVPRALWARVRPRPGVPVHITRYPQGGNGGGKALRIAAMVAVAYLSYGTSLYVQGTAYAAYAGAAAAAVSIVGSLAINALIQPPSAKSSASSDPFNQLSSLTGTSNQAAPYGVIPCVVGTTRFMLRALAPGEERTISGLHLWRPGVEPGIVPRDMAIHEAGHAVASWWTGKGVAEIRVGEYGSQAFSRSVRRTIEGDNEAEVKAFCRRLGRKRLADAALREMVVAAAGPLAEGKLKGWGFSWRVLALDPGYREWREGDPPSDLHAWMACALLVKPKDRRRISDASFSLAACLLAGYWPQLEALADALQERRHLTGEDFHAVTGLAVRPAGCALALGQIEVTV